jgi:hypothetical protein
MADEAGFADLELRMAALRKRAAHARWIARQITDKAAVDSLFQHAEELDRKAAELEAEAAILRLAAQEDQPDQDIAALKPPTDEPPPDDQNSA